MLRVSRNNLVLSALATTLGATGCSLVDVGPHLVGSAELSDDPALASVEPTDLGAYILYKSGTCPNPGADTCLDERATGRMMADPAQGNELKPLDGAAFPAGFSRATERSLANVQLMSAALPDATWSFGLVMLAPYDDRSDDMDAALLDAMPDDTPVALGVMAVETQGLGDDELAARGLNPANEHGYSLTWVKIPDDMIACQRADATADCGAFEAVDPAATNTFMIESLGRARARIAFPSFAPDEVLEPL